MIRRILVTYLAELQKAARRKQTYVGPLLVFIVVCCATIKYPIARDTVSDYAFIATAVPLALDILGLLLLLIYCGGLVASELSSGTIRLVLVRPLHRHEFLAAKLLHGMTYAILLTAVASIASWGIALALGDLAGVSYGGEIVYTGREMIEAYALGILLGLLPQFAAVAFAIFVSTCNRNVGAAIGTTVGFWFLVEAVKYPLGIAKFLFSTHLTSVHQVFIDYAQGMPGRWFPAVGWSAATSLVALVLFAGLAALVLGRRNLYA